MGVVIIVLITMGKLLEANAKGKTNSAIKKLIELKPKQALVLKDGKESFVKLELLSVGNIVIIKPGERIPADGIITTGSSIVDESMLTGESIPVKKKLVLK